MTSTSWIALFSVLEMIKSMIEAILQQFNPTAEVHMLRSVDSVSEEDGMHHAYPAEFLQQLNAGGLPSALLCLKVGSPVILLRNLDPGEGLCNGTRMVVLNVRRKVLQCRIISKDRRFRGKVVLIPRIRLSPNAKTLPVPLKRLQFPVRMAFAMTINKSQGQSVEHVGLICRHQSSPMDNFMWPFQDVLHLLTSQYFFQSKAKRVEGHLM